MAAGRTLALALALAGCVAQPALAARLATAPVTVVGDGNAYTCSVQYLGASTSPVPVQSWLRPRWWRLNGCARRNTRLSGKCLSW